MTIKSSGTLRASELNSEFFYNNSTNTLRKISEFYGKGYPTALPSSGLIRYSNFYGKSASPLPFTLYVFNDANYGSLAYSFTSLGTFNIGNYVTSKGNAAWVSLISSWYISYGAGAKPGILKISYWTNPGGTTTFPTTPNGVFYSTNVDAMPFLGNFGLDNQIVRIQIDLA